MINQKNQNPTYYFFSIPALTMNTAYTMSSISNENGTYEEEPGISNLKKLCRILIFWFIIIISDRFLFLSELFKKYKVYRETRKVYAKSCIGKHAKSLLYLLVYSHTKNQVF